MTVEALMEKTGFEVISLSNKSKMVEGCYAGDLLSWVMGKAEQGCLWLTIMTNINVLAVASLLDLACVVVCENAVLDEIFIKTAESKNINVLRTDKPLYEACLIIGNLSNE
ncbi:MAG: hypothetical protein PHW77_00620 [Eubacteriales bacterium]|nr:hypothetical protein [Eubacteriales bacterium]